MTSVASLIRIGEPDLNPLQSVALGKDLCHFRGVKRGHSETPYMPSMSVSTRSSYALNGSLHSTELCAHH